MCARGTFACQRRGHWYTTLLGLVFHVQNVFACFADVYVRKAYSSFNFMLFALSFCTHGLSKTFCNATLCLKYVATLEPVPPSSCSPLLPPLSACIFTLGLASSDVLLCVGMQCAVFQIVSFLCSLLCAVESMKSSL